MKKSKDGFYIMLHEIKNVSVMKLLFYTLTISVILSMHAILILAAVAGESNLNHSVLPDSFLAALIASRIAKKIDDDRNNGGSPTAYKIFKYYFLEL